MPWMAWSLTLLFFAYQFILRLFPSLMMPEIMHQFSIDATSFGFLSAMYYFGYSGMQIPIAILLDRFGPRRVVALCAIVCGISTLMFLYTNNWLVALLGRFLIGASSAAGFLGTSKAISLWFPQNLYARMVGYTFTFGLLGALYGGRPVNFMIEQLGWQKVLLTIAMGGAVIGAFIFLFVKEKATTKPLEKTFAWSNFAFLLKNKSLVSLALANLLMVGSLEGFADVWGVTYLTKAYGLTQGSAAGVISFIFVGMLFGGPLLAYISEKIGSYIVIAACGCGMAGLFIAMLIFPSFFNEYLLSVLFFGVGIMCCYQVIVFSVGTELMDKKLMGITVAFLNSINMLGGSFFHTMIGSFMDFFWEGTSEGSVRVYSAEAYTYALLVIPITSFVGAMIVNGISSSHKKSRLRNRNS
jgi:MFS family permease